MAKKSLNIWALTLPILLYIVSYSLIARYIESRSDTPQPITSLETLPSVMLNALAGEFKGIFADLLVLEAAAQVGTEVIKTPDGKFIAKKKAHDWKRIHRLFVNSQILDPYFQHTYMLAQGLLPWDPGMVEETQSILHTAAQALPWDWNPKHLIGFNYYYFMNNPGKAGKLFLQAAQIKNSPSFLSILGARLAHKGSETEAAIMLLHTVLSQKDPSEPSYTDIENRLSALKGALLIEKAQKLFTQKYDQKPSTVQQLIDAGLLQAIPPNPYNTKYCIDSNGLVSFDNPNCNQ